MPPAYLESELPKNTDCSDGHLDLYFLSYLWEALYRVGRSGWAENLIREHYAIMRDHGAWAFWETLKDGRRGRGSLCHGWSASPLIAFSEHILGVREGVPGDPSQMLIAPQSDSLDWAQGSVPHPAGLIHISWRVDGAKLLLALDLPHGVHARIQPLGRLGRLELIRIPSAELVPAEADLSFAMSA